jgi:O-acetyl-ADP-ribose deacetylase (regulator of RNase III)
MHSVSQDLAMGKGIAVEFKKRYSSVNALKAQKKVVGQVARLKATSKMQASFASSAGVTPPDAGFQDRFVYYMITKARYFHKPTMEDFTASLNELRDLAVSDKVSAISMPKIGCGLDLLDWKVIKPLIEQTFAGTGITINVYSL